MSSAPMYRKSHVVLAHRWDLAQVFPTTEVFALAHALGGPTPEESERKLAEALKKATLDWLQRDLPLVSSEDGVWGVQLQEGTIGAFRFQLKDDRLCQVLVVGEDIDRSTAIKLAPKTGASADEIALPLAVSKEDAYHVYTDLEDTDAGTSDNIGTVAMPLYRQVPYRFWREPIAKHVFVECLGREWATVHDRVLAELLPWPDLPPDTLGALLAEQEGWPRGYAAGNITITDLHLRRTYDRGAPHDQRSYAVETARAPIPRAELGFVLSLDDGSRVFAGRSVNLPHAPLSMPIQRDEDAVISTLERLSHESRRCGSDPARAFRLLLRALSGASPKQFDIPARVPTLSPVTPDPEELNGPKPSFLAAQHTFPIAKSIAVTKDGARLAVAEHSAVLIYDLESGKLSRSYQLPAGGEGDWIATIAWSGDSSTLACVTKIGHVWRCRDNSVPWTIFLDIDHQLKTSRLALDHTGDNGALSSNTHLLRFNEEMLTDSIPFPTGGEVHDLWLDEDDHVVAVVDDLLLRWTALGLKHITDGIRAVDPETGERWQKARRLKPEPSPVGTHVLMKGKCLSVAMSSLHEVERVGVKRRPFRSSEPNGIRWDLESGRVEETWRIESALVDRQYVFCNGRVLNLLDGSWSVPVCVEHRRFGLEARFNEEDQLTLLIHDVESGAWSFREHEEISVRFDAADGWSAAEWYVNEKAICAVSHDGEIRVWSPSGAMLTDDHGLAGRFDVDFSPRPVLCIDRSATWLVKLLGPPHRRHLQRTSDDRLLPDAEVDQIKRHLAAEGKDPKAWQSCLTLWENELRSRRRNGLAPRSASLDSPSARPLEQSSWAEVDWREQPPPMWVEADGAILYRATSGVLKRTRPGAHPDEVLLELPAGSQTDVDLALRACVVCERNQIRKLGLDGKEHWTFDTQEPALALGLTQPALFHDAIRERVPARARFRVAFCRERVLVSSSDPDPRISCLTSDGALQWSFVLDPWEWPRFDWRWARWGIDSKGEQLFWSNGRELIVWRFHEGSETMKRELHLLALPDGHWAAIGQDGWSTSREDWPDTLVELLLGSMLPEAWDVPAGKRRFGVPESLLRADAPEVRSWLQEVRKDDRRPSLHHLARGADVRGANLVGASGSGADLRGCDFRGADLREAHLVGALLDGALLNGADLRHADLSHASLRGADLRGARTENARWLGADKTSAVV